MDKDHENIMGEKNFKEPVASKVVTDILVSVEARLDTLVLLKGNSQICVNKYLINTNT